MLDRIARTCLRYRLFEPGDKVGVAVSGGADSLCLLEALVELRARFGITLAVIHVNHRLRGSESEDDADFVARQAQRHGLPFHLESVDVGGVAVSQRQNLEETAREVRLGFFARLREGGRVDKVATGHTLTDQAETVLFRFLRGAGTAGLSGILPRTAEGVVRPLLEVRRAEAEAFLRERAIAWREDSSNRSREWVRNRIRLDLMPLLEREYNPAIQEQLAQAGTLARDEEEFWAGYLEGLAAGICERQAAVRIVDCQKMSGLPVAVGRRLLRQMVREVRGGLRGIEFGHIERLRELALDCEGHGRAILPGIDAMRSFEWLRIAPPKADPVTGRLESAILPVPGEARLPGIGTIRTILREGLPPEYGYNEGQKRKARLCCVDWDRAASPLTLRYWLPGDAYLPAGANHPEKLKQMFQNTRIPLWERRFWPIIESSRGILWSRRFGVAAGSEATGQTRQVLEIQEIRETP